MISPILPGYGFKFDKYAGCYLAGSQCRSASNTARQTAAGHSLDDLFLDCIRKKARSDLLGKRLYCCFGTNNASINTVENEKYKSSEVYASLFRAGKITWRLMQVSNACCLFHHGPSHSDAQLDAILADSRDGITLSGYRALCGQREE